MKTLLVSVIFVVALLVSCQHDFDDLHYTIVNNSSETVSFYFNNDPNRIYLYATNTSRSFTINSGRGIQRPENITFSGHPRSIRMDTTGGSTRGFTYTFVSVYSITLNVTNTLPIEVTIRADDFIDGDYLTIPPNPPPSNETNTRTSTIYTDSPRFTTTPRYLPGSGYPIRVTWTIDASGMHAHIVAFVR